MIILPDKFSIQISTICKAGGIENWHGIYNRSLNKFAEKLNYLKLMLDLL